MNLSNYKHAEPTLKPNFVLIPVNNIKLDDKGVEEFNEIYQYVLNNDFKELVRTPSGGISINRNSLRGKRFDLQYTKSVIELTIKYYDGYYRFQVGYSKENTKDGISGHRAYIELYNVLKKFNLSLEPYGVDKEDGLRIKQEIPKPLIKVVNERYLGRTFTNAHHLDLNASYWSGIVNAHPELKPAIEYIYQKTKKNKPVYKAILTHSYGYFQSSKVGYRYSQLSKDAVVYNNEYIRYLAEQLTTSGRRVIAFNTDGIWYDGEVYHDKFEGDGLGLWKNDHVNCTLRFKSHGCYEYIEDNTYHPVFRGTSSYERTVPRDEWQWGDIYKGELVSYSFKKGIGFIKE